VPRSSEHIENITGILREWAEDPAARKMVVLLGHQYTQEGLAWDTLKGEDRVKANILDEAARRTGCQAYLALLTFWESGAAESSGGGYRGRGSWYDDEDEDDGPYEMVEVYDSSLTADRWSDREGNRLSIGPMEVEKDEVLDPEALQEVKPEEAIEGYMGNEGMTLERWYRHAAIVIWPEKAQFDVLCGNDGARAVPALELMVKQWQKARGEEAAKLKANCLDFARAILGNWREVQFSRSYAQEAQKPGDLLKVLQTLDAPPLISVFLREVMLKDVGVDPGKSLLAVCQHYGWEKFQGELERVFKGTNSATIERNSGLLEHLCSARAQKNNEWLDLCQNLARPLVSALESVDGTVEPRDWQAREVNRAKVLELLVCSLVVTEQTDLLSRVVTHVLTTPSRYPLKPIHLSTLTSLQPWLKKHVKKPDAALARWIASCRQELESLTAAEPQPPSDYRRDASLRCKCAECNQLKRFLEDPNEASHRFSMRQERRDHLENTIHNNNCDLDCKTERRGSPHTLVCTKNTASYQEKLKTYHQDQKHLAMVRSIESSLPR
jgi:hypothetical protein